jgi:NAD(P)-dependent dehydrogenase (short-subunit alcohol dehydrogenase family)
MGFSIIGIFPDQEKAGELTGMIKPSDYNQIEALADPGAIFDLSGRVGLITGGGGKMGQQFSAVLAKAGAEVVISDANGENCRAAGSFYEKQLGKKSVVLECDVSDETSVKDLFTEIKRRYGRLDFFISNVMGKPEGYYRPFEEYDVSTWNRIHDINVTGTFLCCREASPLLEKSGNGSIVITASIYGMVAPDFRIYDGCAPVKNLYGDDDPLTTPGAYASSKGGLIALARYLSVLLAPKKIRVNVLTPGGVYDGQEPTFHDAYVQRTPLGRMATWSDYNGSILFLVSDASRYMTGANLVVDGGWTCW